MELHQLEYFVAVAEEAGFTKAAARLHIAQPGVSAQVRRLERELGQPLFDRSGRTVRLTDVGAAVLPYARAALAAVTGARHTVDELTGLARGHVAVGMVTSLGSDVDLPGMLAGFHERHPAIEITLTEANSDRLIENLQTGHLDLAFVALAGASLPGLGTQVFADEHLAVVVGRDDPLTARTTIDVGSLRDLALITLPQGTGMRSLLDKACAEAGFQPRVAFEASDPNVLAQLAERGLGAAIVPESLAHSHPGDLHVLTLIRPRLRGQLALAWRAEAPVSPAARALTAHARAALTARPGPPR